jgi:hypothetical protein
MWRLSRVGIVSCMMMGDSTPTMSDPAEYRIRIQGRIGPSWRGRLAGMVATESIGEGGGVVTTLVGRLADQAALAGILNTIYGLQLPVISAEWLGEPGAEEGPG